MKFNLAIVAAAATLFSGLAGAATISTGDQITTVTQFNGFEGLTAYTVPSPTTYTEDGITVNEVGQSSTNDIWTTYGNTSLGFTGDHSWYADGGDFGFTRITEQDASDFTNVSLMTGNGWTGQGGIYLNYVLLENGVAVFSGSLLQNLLQTPITFAGGAFDEIWLSASYGSPQAIGFGGYQALAIDDIRVGLTSAVPEPGTLGTLMAGLGLIGFMARRRQDRSN